MASQQLPRLQIGVCKGQSCIMAESNGPTPPDSCNRQSCAFEAKISTPPPPPPPLASLLALMVAPWLHNSFPGCKTGVCRGQRCWPRMMHQENSRAAIINSSSHLPRFPRLNAA